MLADALAVVRQGEYEKAKLHLLALGMTPLKLRSSSGVPGADCA